MSLFQNSVLRLALEQLNHNDIKVAFEKYKTAFLPKIENIKKSKEEQYQYGFFQDLFVDIFSYVLNPSPDFNLTTEFKNLSDSKKVDGAILVDGEVIAVIELKSTKTKSMQSIVNQAFNYKNNHPTCKYVITSNFEKLRFYIEHSNEFEEFNLFNLNLEKFTLLYLLLNVKDMLSLKILALKKQSKLKDEQISNELYKKYSQLRLDLFHNIKKNNNQEPLLLLNLTQKILDRMIFIFFGEDRGILKTNTIQAIIDHHKGDIEDRSLYHFYKIYFKGINKGNKKLDIPEYNGGLFACDEVLDALIIDDEVLKELPLQLSAYDFNSDIDVDILGHIFENSLSDLEEIKANIEESDFDKSKTKRKKDGVFYTPEYITEYIVENTLGKLCKDKREALGLENIEVLIPKNPKKLTKGELKIKESLEAYRAYLLGLKIVDPACGSGAFLNQALNFLIYEHEYIDENEKILMGGNVLGLFDVKKEILEHNLFGVDINEESVEIAKLSLWLRTVERGRKLNKLANNIKVGNSLIGDKSVVDNAFVWEEEFPEVFAKGGFDVVIGNPPYGAKLSKTDKDYFNDTFETVEYQIDTYTLFMEKAYKLLQKDGKLGYIIPSTWLTMFYFKDLRKYLIEKTFFEKLLLFRYQVFSDVTAETSILIFSKNENNNKNIIINSFNKDDEIEVKEYTNISQDDWLDGYELGFNLLFGGRKLKVINKIFDNSNELYSYANVTVGIKPYQTNKGTPKQTKDDVKNRIFDANEKINDTYYNYIVGGSINKYVIHPSKTNWLKYGKFLAEPRQSLNFFQKKIMVRQTSDKIIGAIDFEGFLSLNNVHNIIMTNKILKYETLVCILNSKLMDFYYKFLVPEEGRTFAEVKAVNLKRLPIKEFEKEYKQEPFKEKADMMLSLSKLFQTKKEKFLNRLKTNLDIEKLSKKLEAFYNYDFKELLKELKKKKVTLSLKEQDEWEDYFNDYQKELLELKSEIDKTDKEIDVLVYKLYGLSDEEIKIVEGS